MKTVVHIIPHAHWDREWYMPLEVHRARLIDQMDRVLELLEKDKTYTYHLDGQMIAVEDYLRIRPEKEESIKRFVSENRLFIGPWYVLQDEFLTSGEANVRNLLYGMAMAGQFGNCCRIGYLPDAFGNVGQMPQLFAQAGMKATAFGRGVTLRPEDPDPEEHFPRHSEFLWQSPDGSAVPAIFFSGWYNNAQEIPTDPEEAKVYWDERLAHARRFASSRHLLFLNGADHQPVQRNLPEALETARALYPDIEFVCSGFEQFIRCVLQDSGSEAETVCCELAGQESDGTNTLCNTASSRAPIKKLNRENESLLALTAEPLLSMAAIAGMKIDNALLRRAWKLLMENHPHDSICGCGIDAVHRETVTRYEKSIQLGEYLVQRAGEYLAKQIRAPKINDAAAAFAVFNPSGWERSQTMSVEVGVDREWGTREARPKVLAKQIKDYRLYDSAGREVPAEIEDQGVQFGYELPEDSFRRPYFERKIRITFSAVRIPEFGYAVYYLKQAHKRNPEGILSSGHNCMENRFISVRIHKNGTFDVTEKKSGRIFRGLGLYEDTGDVGNEYIFREAAAIPLTTGNADTEITYLEDNESRTVYKIEHLMYLPLCADIDLEEAREAMTRPLQRNIGRVNKKAAFQIITYLALDRDDPVLRIHTEFNNTVKDHRLRMLFPCDLNTNTHFADSVFDVTERPDMPGPNWTNPSRCQRMQYFAAAQDEQAGIAVLNRGTYEYEILPERKTIAVTLLRSIGELGDWGVFPTPDAECQGPVSMDLGILVYEGNTFRENGCREAVQFQTDMRAFQLTEAHGTLPETGSFLHSAGKGMAVTSLKPSEDEKALVLRAVNVTEGPSVWQIGIPENQECFDSDVTESRGDLIGKDETGQVRIRAGKKEIKTIRIGMR